MLYHSTCIYILKSSNLAALKIICLRKKNVYAHKINDFTVFEMVPMQ